VECVISGRIEKLIHFTKFHCVMNQCFAEIDPRQWKQYDIFGPLNPQTIVVCWKKNNINTSVQVSGKYFYLKKISPILIIFVPEVGALAIRS